MFKWQNEKLRRIERNKRKNQRQKLECCSSTAAGNKKEGKKKQANTHALQVVYRLRASLATPSTTTINEIHAKFFSSKMWTHRHRSHLKIYFRMMRGGFPKVTTDSHDYDDDNNVPTRHKPKYIFFLLFFERKQWWCDDDKEVEQQLIYIKLDHTCVRRTHVNRRDSPADCNRVVVCAET